MIVCDAMVIIHLAKTGLLPSACANLGGLCITPKVYEEVVVEGRKRGYADAVTVKQMIDDGKIRVVELKKNEFLQALSEMNVEGGEAESAALALQTNAFLASDDDNVRKKARFLRLSLIGTPAIILRLFKKKAATKDQATEAVARLRRISWFSSAVLDELLKEVE